MICFYYSPPDPAHVPKSVKSSALQALHSFPDFIKKSDSLKTLYVTLFMDTDEDSSVRTLASDMILRNDPSKIELKYITDTLIQEKNIELKTFILSRLSEHGLRSYNWDLLSGGGYSGSFRRSMSSPHSSINSSFSFGVELSGMLLKRSTLEVSLDDDEEETELLQLDIFAGGLSGFIGDQADPNDDEESNAGMVLSVLGNKLRPFVFFNSMGELMNIYWSGAAESKTSALQVNF